MQLGDLCLGRSVWHTGLNGCSNQKDFGRAWQIACLTLARRAQVFPARGACLGALPLRGSPLVAGQGWVDLIDVLVTELGNQVDARDNYQFTPLHSGKAAALC